MNSFCDNEGLNEREALHKHDVLNHATPFLGNVFECKNNNKKIIAWNFEEEKKSAKTNEYFR